jgi:hypothetical protein
MLDSYHCGEILNAFAVVSLRSAAAPWGHILKPNIYQKPGTEAFVGSANV